ncbi:MAG: hypothetical protein PVH45_04930 [Candidatus Omnitrophota bacterium]
MKTKKSNGSIFSLTRAKYFLCLLVFVFLASACAVGFAFQYEPLGRRDPFVPLVGVTKSTSVSGARGILTIEDVSLQGIVMGADGKKGVIINGEIIREGERVDRLFIESIGNNIVTIKIEDDTFKIKLYE